MPSQSTWTKNVSALSGRAFWQDPEVKQRSPGAFDEAVCRWPPGFAADAGIMQIQLWEGTVVRCGEGVSQSMTRHTAR
jgi:hypothetical protein